MNGCKICGGKIVSKCRCSSKCKHDLESLENGHGALCENGHRCAYDSDLYITVPSQANNKVGRIAGKIEKELVGGALYDFLGYLTSVENELTDGPQEDATMALNVMFDWLEERHPELAEAMNSVDYDMKIKNWMKSV